MNLPKLIPVALAAKIAGWNRESFTACVIDEQLVETGYDYMGHRRYVVLESLEKWMQRSVTEIEFVDACRTRKATALYQRAYRARLAQVTDRPDDAS
jgi:hypothetical protein